MGGFQLAFPIIAIGASAGGLEAVSEPAQAVVGEERSATPSPRRVLIVDDNDDAAESLALAS